RIAGCYDEDQRPLKRQRPPLFDPGRPGQGDRPGGLRHRSGGGSAGWQRGLRLHSRRPCEPRAGPLQRHFQRTRGQEMNSTPRKGFVFTGWHMFGAMVLFFGVIISVNLYMAWQATHTWSGLVVKNTYIASQEFNGKVAEAKALAAT